MAIAKDTSEDFEICPSGQYAGVCVGVWDIGIQRTTFQGIEKLQHQEIWMFQLAPKITQGDLAGQHHRLCLRQTVSLSAKSHMGKRLISWRGRPFTEEEKKDGFNTKKIIGVPCFCNILHAQSDGKTYANIDTITALPEGIAPVPMPAEAIQKPEWVEKLILKATYMAGDEHEPEIRDDTGGPNEAMQEHVANQTTEPAEPVAQTQQTGDVPF